MAFIGSLITTVKADTSPFRKGMSKAERSTRKLRAQLKTLSVSFIKFGAVITGVAAGVAIAALKMAADFQEADQKFGVVFGNVSKEAESMRMNLVKSFGLSKTAATELLSGTGDLLTGFGFTDRAALKLSEKVQQISVDLASFNNTQGGAARVSRIITKALLGQRDGLIEIGVAILDADVKQELMARGQAKLTGLAKRAAIAQATYKLILEQTGKAQGDFSRSSGSLTNLTKTLVARLNDLAVTFGEKLIPFATVLTKNFLKLIEGASKYADENKKIVDSGLNDFLKTTVLSLGKLVDTMDLAIAAGNLFSATFRGGIFVLLKPIDLLQKEFKKLTDSIFSGLGAKGVSKESFLSRFEDQLEKLATQDLREAVDAFRNFKNGVNEKSAADFFKQLEKDIKKVTKAADDATKANDKLKDSTSLVIDETIALNDFFEKQLEIMNKREQAQEKLIEQAKRIFEETRTPLERIEEEIKKINKLIGEGVAEGFEEAFDRKIKQLKEQRKKLLDAIKKENDENIVAAKFRPRKRDKQEVPEAIKKSFRAGFREIDLRNIDIKGLQKEADIERKILAEGKKGNALTKKLIEVIKEKPVGAVAS